ncbi:hypothetical protein Q7P37_004036 [Cladosporium fusiforme]
MGGPSIAVVGIGRHLVGGQLLDPLGDLPLALDDQPSSSSFPAPFTASPRPSSLVAAKLTQSNLPRRRLSPCPFLVRLSVHAASAAPAAWPLLLLLHTITVYRRSASAEPCECIVDITTHCLYLPTTFIAASLDPRSLRSFTASSRAPPPVDARRPPLTRRASRQSSAALSPQTQPASHRSAPPPPPPTTAPRTRLHTTLTTTAHRTHRYPSRVAHTPPAASRISRRRARAASGLLHGANSASASRTLPLSSRL